RWDGSEWVVPDWQSIVDENADRFDPTFGLLADSVVKAGGCSTALGAGAGLMLADSAGSVSRYEPDASHVTRQALAACPLTGIDLGEVPPAAGAAFPSKYRSGAPPATLSREEALRQLDSSVHQILEALPDGTTFVLVSTADETSVARLRVLMASGPGPGETTYSSGLMTTNSTRQTGLVQLTDVTALILSTLDVSPITPIVGSAPTVDRTDESLVSRVAALIELDERAQVIVRITFPINQAIIVVLLVVYAGFAAAGVRLARQRRAQQRTPTVPRQFQQALTATSLLLAAVPVSTYLANVVPWWRLAHGPSTGLATAVMLLTSVMLAAVLAATAWFLPWARQAYRPVTLVAGVTVVVLALDVMSGSHLQFASALGLSPIAAGRFYGFGNVAFSVFATCALFACVGISRHWVVAGRRLTASLFIGAFGLAVALIDGWPLFGADFGGMIALIVGFGVFAVLVAPGGLSLRRLGLILLAGAAFSALISFADYLRPVGSRTHLGEFMASLLAGDAGSTVVRKLSASLSSFTFSAAAPLVPVVFAIFVWLVLRPERFRATALLESYRATPTLRPGLIGVLVTAGFGALVNDSGVIVTATMLGVAVPLAVAAAADPRRTARTPPEPDQSLVPLGPEGLR
ncbi:MAG TPA: hypothetical protein VMT27_08750, partial [Actinomycetes bacterium]|nr:hypothetical protein [Actinomycetes bacterium]